MNNSFKSYPHKTLIISLLAIGLSLPIYANADLSADLAGGANLSSDSMTDTIKAKATDAVKDRVASNLPDVGAATALGGSANMGGLGSSLSSDSMTDTIKAKATDAVKDRVTGALPSVGAATALGGSNIGGLGGAASALGGSSLSTGSMTDTVKAKATDEVKTQVSKHGKQIKDKLTSSVTGGLPSAGAAASLGGSADLGGVGASLGSGLGVKLP